MDTKDRYIKRMREMNRGTNVTTIVKTAYSRPADNVPVGLHGNEEHNPKMAELGDFEDHTASIATTSVAGHVKGGGNVTIAPDGTMSAAVGAATFFDLEGVNATEFTDFSTFLVRVAADESGLEFVDGATLYAAIDHNHDAAYAAIDHNHSGVYALAGHNHDASYAAIGHNHDLTYAAISHTHALTTLTGFPSAYTGSGGFLLRVNGGASAVEFVDGTTLYASTSHNHDASYSAIGHNHNSSYVLKAGDTMTGPLIITATGAATYPLLIEADNPSGGTGSQFAVHIYSTAQAPAHTYARALGTKSSPTAMSSGQRILTFQQQAHDGTNFVASTQMLFETDGAVSTGIAPGRIRVYTADSTGALVEAARWTSTQNLYLFKTAYVGSIATTNSKMSLGLTINQAGFDDEILALQSSDVAHGITDFADTATFLSVSKFTAGGGGAHLRGFGESTIGIVLHAFAVVGNTTKSTAGVAPLALDSRLKSGTGVTSMGANANLVTIADNGTVRFIFDADGDSHQDVGTAWTNFDSFDDAILLTDLSIAVSRANDPIKKRFSEFLKYNRAALEDAKLVTFNDNGHHFVNMSRLTMLHTGAIRQLHETMQRIEERLINLERALG